MNEANPAQLVPYVTGGGFAEDTANHVLGGSAAMTCPPEIVRL